VRDFVNRSFKEIGVILDRKGTGIEEKWYDTITGNCLVEVDPQYFRPAEVNFLLGDSSKIRRELWWKTTYTLQTMCKEMVISDIAKFNKA
jgi:GDPmannose 4,6-dehydratase